MFLGHPTLCKSIQKLKIDNLKNVFIHIIFDIIKLCKEFSESLLFESLFVVHIDIILNMKHTIHMIC